MFQEVVAAYTKNRAASAPLPTESAPYTSSTFFKLQPQTDRALARDWTQHLSVQGQNQRTSTLKGASKNATQAKLLSLGTARPAPEFYPWSSIAMTNPILPSFEGGSDDQVTSITCKKGERNFDLGVALNYGYAAGSPQMIRFITEHIEMVHSPPYQDWESCLTCSSTSAVDILLRLLCDRGDWLITEEYTYPGTIEAAKSMGLNILPVAMDEQGLLPDDLDKKLGQWSSESRRPSVLYTIPSGQNPTGATQSTRRRQEIYAIAEDHDLLIIEDDPYYFIQLEETLSLSNGKASVSRSDQYLNNLLPSYLSLDTSGRVLRLETTSKILAPGLRCGWMTGCSQLVSKFISVTELGMVAPNGPSQVMLYKLLDQAWGHEGFVTWLDHLSARYRRRLQIMVSSCEKYLPLNICSWSMPRSGMFLWIQLDWSRHPMVLSESNTSCPGLGLMLDVENSIHNACVRHGVQVSKGSWFAPAQPTSDKIFLRVTFAATAESDLVEAIERFGAALHKDFDTPHR